MRSSPARTDHDRRAAHAAVRDVHGSRLFGFALLLTLGERRLAASLAAGALARAGGHLDELEHPERAAAWLRADVRRSASRRPPPLDADARLVALHSLGVGTPVLSGLARLERDERAALIASTIERFDVRDVATIVGRDGVSLERLLRRARTRFLEGYRSAPPDPDASRVEPGPLTSLVRATAARALP